MRKQVTSAYDMQPVVGILMSHIVDTCSDAHGSLICMYCTSLQTLPHSFSFAIEQEPHKVMHFYQGRSKCVDLKFRTNEPQSTRWKARKDKELAGQEAELADKDKDITRLEERLF